MKVEIKVDHVIAVIKKIRKNKSFPPRSRLDMLKRGRVPNMRPEKSFLSMSPSLTMTAPDIHVKFLSFKMFKSTSALDIFLGLKISIGGPCSLDGLKYVSSPLSSIHS